MNANYPRAFGFLESAVHRALRELSGYEMEHVHFAIDAARTTLINALHDLEFNHGIELHWPVKEINHGR